MNSFKGRHLGFLGLLCVGWATARVVIIGWDGAVTGHPVQVVAAHPSTKVPPVVRVATSATMRAERSCCLQPVIFRRQRGGTSSKYDNLATFGSFAADLTGSVKSDFGTDISRRPTNMSDIAVLPKPNTLLAPPLLRRRSLRADTYAYSFWRGGNGQRGLAAGGQYGGSQSGLIATFFLQRAEDVEEPQRLALMVRAAVAHDNIDEREVAMGIRLRPLETLPVSITAERRFRHDRRDAFAIYAAGGVSDAKLPLKFRIDSFAQAGVVSGKQAGPFFDAFVRADRNVLRAGAVQVHAGAGAWAGGQRNAARLDIGPSLRTDVSVGDIRLGLNLDWRFRVAGNATPGNGPALTLSTGF